MTYVPPPPGASSASSPPPPPPPSDSAQYVPQPPVEQRPMGYVPPPPAAQPAAVPPPPPGQAVDPDMERSVAEARRLDDLERRLSEVEGPKDAKDDESSSGMEFRLWAPGMIVEARVCDDTSLCEGVPLCGMPLCDRERYPTDDSKPSNSTGEPSQDSKPSADDDAPSGNLLMRAASHAATTAASLVQAATTPRGDPTVPMPNFSNPHSLGEGNTLEDATLQLEAFMNRASEELVSFTHDLDDEEKRELEQEEQDMHDRGQGQCEQDIKASFSLPPPFDTHVTLIYLTCSVCEGA